MKVKLLGIKKAQGTGKKSGKPYDGYFLSFGVQKEGYVGMACSEQFINAEFMNAPLNAVQGDPGKLLGHTLEMDFDDRGFLLACTLL